VAKMATSRIINCDGQSILNEILEWRAELDSTIADSIVYETLETIIDIIYDNSECETEDEHL